MQKFGKGEAELRSFPLPKLQHVQGPVGKEVGEGAKLRFPDLSFLQFLVIPVRVEGGAKLRSFHPYRYYSGTNVWSLCVGRRRSFAPSAQHQTKHK